MESEGVPHGLEDLRIDMSDYHGDTPEFMSIALLNVFTLFPSLRSLRLDKVNLEKDLGLKTVADYIRENKELHTLQLKECVLGHKDFAALICKGILVDCPHLKHF